MLPKIKVNDNKCCKIHPEIIFKMNFDGCSKNNPGLAGAGYSICEGTKEVYFGHLFVGANATNNHAEYAGLILGLQQAIEFGIKRMIVEGDSLLVISQMTGKYKCKSPNLIELYEKAKELEKQFEELHFNHILRNENKRADQLSNIAVDEYLKVKSTRELKETIQYSKS
jgi:ribonuclease HI